jgi:HEAT repeats
MRILILTIVAICGAAPSLSAAQSPSLAQVFQNLRSSDPATRKKANESIVDVTVKEFPTIEKDEATICNALRDPDPYIRLQAAAIFSTIAHVQKKHASVIQDCLPELLAEARDTPAQTFKAAILDHATEARNDALFALAMDPAGTPPQAQAVFRDQLKSNNFRSAEVAATGLLRMQGPDAAANQRLVTDALQSAPDAKHRLNMLYAITCSGTQSDELFQAVRQMVDDPDPDVQQAALDALVRSAPDQSQAVTALQNLQDSPTASALTKEMAKGYLKSIGKRRQ